MVAGPSAVKLFSFRTSLSSFKEKKKQFVLSSSKTPDSRIVSSKEFVPWSLKRFYLSFH